MKSPTREIEEDGEREDGRETDGREKDGGRGEGGGERWRDGDRVKEGMRWKEVES